MKLFATKIKNRTFKIIFIFLIGLEIIACYYAYYTLGEVKQMICFLLLFLNVIPILLYFYRFKIISGVFVLMIAFSIIPNQIILLSKWSDLKKESTAIKKYIYRYKEQHHSFPKSILAYEFKNKKLAKYFSYRNRDGENFGLHYYVGTYGTTHFYNHNSGKWSYYPD